MKGNSFLLLPVCQLAFNEIGEGYKYLFYIDSILLMSSEGLCLLFIRFVK